MQPDSTRPADPGSSSGLDDLLGCLEHYQAAVLDHEDAIVFRSAATGDAASGLSLVAADAVTAARVGLYRCLVTNGWRPPASLAAEIELDEVVGHLATGTIGG